MTGTTDIDRVLEDWLTEGPSELPEETIRRTIDLLDETRQRGRWSPPGVERLRRLLPATGLAAALVVGVVVLASLGGGRPPVGGSPGLRFTSDRHGYTIALPDDSWRVEERPGTWDSGEFLDPNASTGVDYIEEIDASGEVVESIYVYLSSQPIPPGLSFNDWTAQVDAVNEAVQPCFDVVPAFSSPRLFHLSAQDIFTSRITIHRCDDFDGLGEWTTVLMLATHNGRGYAIHVWPPGPGSGMSQNRLEGLAYEWLSRISFTVALPPLPSPSSSTSPGASPSPSSSIAASLSTVAQSPSVSASESAPPDASPAGDAGGSVLLPWLAVAVVVAALCVWFVRRRRA